MVKVVIINGLLVPVAPEMVQAGDRPEASGAEAPTHFVGFAARLNSRPDTKQLNREFFRSLLIPI
jgi:hypothetical protein